MSGSFTASVQAFNDKAMRNVTLVLRESAQEVFRRATNLQASAKETGGRFEVGKVPVDTGHLIGTAEVRIGGSAVSTGTEAGEASTPPDYSVAIAQLDAGETVQLVFTAEYAREVEYGTSKMAGRFFVRMAVADWQAIVDEAARKIGQ